MGALETSAVLCRLCAFPFPEVAYILLMKSIHLAELLYHQARYVLFPLGRVYPTLELNYTYTSQKRILDSPHLLYVKILTILVF